MAFALYGKPYPCASWIDEIQIAYANVEIFATSCIHRYTSVRRLGSRIGTSRAGETGPVPQPLNPALLLHNEEHNE